LLQRPTVRTSQTCQRLVTLVSNDVNMTAAKEVTYVGSTSVFLTDFGTVEAVPSRLIGNDRVFLIDPDFVSICTLNGRNFLEQELSQDGDAKTSILCRSGRSSLPRLRHTRWSSILTDHNKSEGAGDCPLSSMRETT
jgi:hypothetical protein